MSYPGLNGFSKDSSGGRAAGSAEETLRLIARLPAPEGLEERVKAGLRSAPTRARVLAWPGSSPLAGGWLRAAAAAAIVFVVAGGGWGIYSRVQPGQPVRGIAGPHVGAPGGFSEGGAVRRPATLVGPTVTAPVPTAAAKPKVATKAAPTNAPGAHATATNKAAVQPAAAMAK